MTSTAPAPGHGDVLTVLVTRGRTPYLAGALGGLAAQTAEPGRVRIVDTAPEPDAHVESLATDILGPTGMSVEVVHQPGAHNFGAAIKASLLARPTDAAWLWLLHDDVLADPAALAELGRAVERSDRIAIAGVKQLSAEGDQGLLEVGVTTSRFGTRITGIQDGELDQGQHDHRDDVFAVGTAGMLVRADVWADLGGTDPALGPFLDGLDLCRRARLAGHRVVVVPRARVAHVRASYRGLRRARRGQDDPGASLAERRRAWAHYLLSSVALPWLIPATVYLLAVAVGRAVWRVAQKDGAGLVAELSGPLNVIAHPGRVARSRRRAARTSRLPRRSLRPLQTSLRSVVALRRDRRLTRLEELRTATAPSELELGERAQLAVRRRWTLLAVTIALSAASAAMLARWVAGGPLWGGALLPADLGLGSAWRQATSSWLLSGLGAAGPPDPLAFVVAGLGTIGLGNVQAGVTGFLVLSPLLAGLAAWFASGAATRRLGLRVLAVLAWTAAPTLWLALAQGRLGAVLAHVALPWVALGVARAIGVDRRDVIAPAVARPDATPSESGPGSVGAAAAAGLALGLVAVGAPALAWVGLVALIVVAVVAPGGRRLRLLVTALGPLLVFAPHLVALASRQPGASWRALLADPGLPFAVAPASALQQLAGWPSVTSGLLGLDANLSDVVRLALGGLLVGWAALALLRRGPLGRGVRVGWALAALGLAAGVVSGEIAVASDGDQVAAIWSGSLVSLIWLGLLIAAVVGGSGLAAWRQRRAAERGGGPARAGITALFCVASVGLVGLAAASGATFLDTSVISGRTTSVVPAIAQETQSSTGSARTLLLRTVAQDSVSWQVTRGNGPNLFDMAASMTARGVTGPPRAGAPAPQDDAQTALSRVVARMAASDGYDPRSDLANAAVAYVVVPQATSRDTQDAIAARSLLVASLDSTAGLGRIMEGDLGSVWRVVYADAEDPAQPARAHIVSPTGEPEAVLEVGPGDIRATVPAGDQGRVVVLAERYDSRWIATLDGKALVASQVDWRQGFELPAAGGVLDISYAPAWHTLVGWTRGIGLIVLALLALPVRRRRGTVE